MNYNNLQQEKIEENLKYIAKNFSIAGQFLCAEKLTSGNINNTYKVSFNENNKKLSYVLQKINSFVFSRPDLIMQNIFEISEHLKTKMMAENSFSERKMLSFHKTIDGNLYFKTKVGEFWRCYDYIDNSVSLNNTNDLQIIENIGYAYGRFQRLLNDFNANKMYVPIPDFHNTKKRFEDLEKSVLNCTDERREKAKTEINLINNCKNSNLVIAKMIESAQIPLKVTHNDTKCNNVLLDKDNFEPLAVIDLDTVMSGVVAFDFGDALRSVGAECDEDEENFDKIKINFEKLNAFSKGFLSEVGSSLSEKEFVSLESAISTMTLELASRFLKDYLDGDIYFKTTKYEHNLIRAQCQLKLFCEFEKHKNTIANIIKSYKC